MFFLFNFANSGFEEVQVLKKTVEVKIAYTVASFT